MTTEPSTYSYTDHTGDQLEIWPSADDCDGASIEVNGEIVHVPAAELPALTTALQATAPITRPEITAQLNRIFSAVDHMSSLEEQDANMVVEMSQDMLNDLIEGRGLAPMVDYVKRYCDVYDTAEEAERIAGDI